MKKILALFFTLVVSVFSQHLIHPLGLGEQQVHAIGLNDTVKILAIMVQFQEDNTDLTSGNGKFDLSTASEPIIDAPPHNADYFADHFIFAENYFAKASNGKFHLKATVLDSVITLSKQMKYYTPINGNLPLTQMIEEAWEKADSIYPGYSFQDYDLFVIFQAGVGKDVDLRSSLGYDPTPYDIPSLFFNLTAFKKILGDDFDGIQLRNSTFTIQNTIVLPSTEVRKIPGIGGDFTLKLGINGLMVASIASYLGLPDLFDTKTGRTAIGRFGLMDGQSIFSFSGVFPPEPSAWEKTYLGWTKPIEIFGNKTVSIPAVGLQTTGDDTIYRIPISAKEYFLLENRQRDVNGDGQTVTMKWNGNIITKTFFKDEDFFSNSNIDSVFGIVLDVDELDWSLPGLVNENNNYKGGILIWHVDESIIEKNLAENTINADPLHRGVDVEEADGSEDIGKSYDFVSPGSGSEDGSPLDYWFDENTSPVYTNEFSETTFPNSLSNSFARSHITIKNFSNSSSRMSFEANVGSTDIQLAKVIRRNNLKFNNDDAPITADINGDGSEEIIYTSGDSIFVLKNDLTPYLNNNSGLFYHAGGRFQPAFYKSNISGNTSPRMLIGAADSTIYFFDSDQSDSVAKIYRTITINGMISTPVTVHDGSPYGSFIVGTNDGKYIIVDTAAHSFQSFYNSVTSVNSFSYASADSINIQGTMLSVDAPIKFIGMVNTTIVVQSASKISLYDYSSHKQINQFALPASSTSSLLLTDLNNDNSADIILGIGCKLYAFNLNGSLLDNFPFTIDAQDLISGSTVVNNKQLIFGTKNGLLYAINKDGKVLKDFPLQTGGMISAPFVGNTYLLAASTDTSIYIWKHANLFDSGDRRWQTYLGSISHSSDFVISNPIVSKSSELLPKQFSYNWPNPVYDGVTYIRYYLGRPATVKIKIVNLAGELVDELNGTGHAAMDNEISWDVSNIQSGIYYAQINATGGGEEQSQIIKIAVVK